MFGCLESKSAADDEPFQFHTDVVIGRPAEDVYALIDWADPRNAKRELGDEVTRVEGAADRFRLILGGLPRHVFDIVVDEAIPHTSYGFTCEITPLIGALARLHELYRFEQWDVGSCRLALVATATFIGPIQAEELEKELQMMTLACRSALGKLKIHAEHGVEAVRAIDDELIF